MRPTRAIPTSAAVLLYPVFVSFVTFALGVPVLSLPGLAIWSQSTAANLAFIALAVVAAYAGIRLEGAGRSGWACAAAAAGTLVAFVTPLTMLAYDMCARSVLDVIPVVSGPEPGCRPDVPRVLMEGIGIGWAGVAFAMAYPRLVASRSWDDFLRRGA